MNLIIREARIDDIDILNYLFQKLLEYERENYDDNIRNDLNIDSYFNKKINDKDNIILVATLDEKIVGYIYAIIDSDNKIIKEVEAKIDSLYVSYEYRNKSIGTKLIEEMINYLRKNEVKYIFIENLVGNKRAKYLYDKLGFKMFREDRRKELI